jgi:hypothetical protein
MTSTHDKLINQILTTREMRINDARYIVKRFKNGVTDAVINNSMDEEYYNTNEYYKKGYDFGVSLYAKLMVNNDFFKEKRKK